MRSKTKVHAALVETTFTGLGEILTHGRLDNHCALTPSTPQAQPFRCFSTSDDSDRLHCKRTLSITEAERPVCDRIWREVDAEEAVERDDSVLITGPPRTGKSHFT